MKATIFFRCTAAILFSSILFLAGCGGLSSVPGSAPQAARTSTFVYVASNPEGSNFQINGFSADSNGQLTPVPGSPFAANVYLIAANQNYLFGTDGKNIYTFSIASSGSLTQVSSINGLQFNPFGQLTYLSLDRSGTSLYAVHENIDSANEGYESFSVDNSTGALTYLGDTFIGCCFIGPLNFLANNVYGYTTSGDHGHATITEFKRNDDGTLTLFGNEFTPPDPGRIFSKVVAPDANNHLAVAFGADSSPGAPPQDLGGVVLAVYTVDDSGNMTTSSTVANMPQTAVSGTDSRTTRIVMSLSGEFLAVGGLGLEVFHFNGADPITPFTGLLMNDPVDQIAWDNDNRFYAISNSAGKLFVFTVTPTSVNQAPGSPYKITNPQGVPPTADSVTGIVVMPRT